MASNGIKPACRGAHSGNPFVGAILFVRRQTLARKLLFGRERSSIISAMRNRILPTFVLCAPALATARARHAGEIFNGMPRADVEEALNSRNSGGIAPLRTDMMLAQDPIDRPGGGNHAFRLCNDELVGFEQPVRPSFRHFTAIVSNFSNQYGSTLYTMPCKKTVVSGPFGQLVVSWRKGADFIGIRYPESAPGDRLRLSWHVNNSRWPA